MTQPLFGVLETPWEIRQSVAPSALVQNADDRDSIACDTIDDLRRIGTIPEGTKVSTHCMPLMLTTPGADGQVRHVRIPQHVAVYKFSDRRTLILVQHDGPDGSSLVYQVGAGMTREVSIGNFAGLLIQGQWERSEDGKVMSWDPTGGVTAVWSIGQRVISLTGQGYSGHELLDVAPSVA